MSSSPKPSKRPLFRMTIDGVFVAGTHGIIVTGCVEAGILQTGDAIEIRSESIQLQTQVVSIESFRKILPSARKGDNIGILLPKDVPHSVLKTNMVVVQLEQE